jgi:hypothetical protein
LHEALVAAGAVPLLRALGGLEDSAATLHTLPPEGPLPAAFVRLRTRIAALASRAVAGTTSLAPLPLCAERWWWQSSLRVWAALHPMQARAHGRVRRRRHTARSGATGSPPAE